MLNIKKEVISRVVMSKDLNSYGTLFGGTLISWMDELSVILAMKFTGKECVTTNIDKIEIKKSCFVNDILDIKADIIDIGKCSLTIQIEAVKFKSSKDFELVSRCKAKFVALNENKKPTRI